MKTTTALLSLLLLGSAHAAEPVSQPAFTAPPTSVPSTGPSRHDANPSGEAPARSRWDHPIPRARTAPPTCGLCAAGVPGYLPCGALAASSPTQ